MATLRTLSLAVLLLSAAAMQANIAQSRVVKPVDIAAEAMKPGNVAEPKADIPDEVATEAVNPGSVAEPKADIPDEVATEASKPEGVADSVPSTATTYEFQAEINRLMDIIIHSLYSNKDIFLRELISNAADALEKVRFLSITDRSLAMDGFEDELKIHIQADPEANTLTIRDSGVGMTREDLIENLGTVARSGTSKFMEAMKKGNEDTIGLIGQFGVGFYSAFLVADRVTVTTKHVNGTQNVWSSDAKSSFQVYEDESNSLGKHGTAVTLHLKEDALDYLGDDKVRGIVSRYSEYVNYPIYLYATKTVSEEVEVEEDETDEEEKEEKEGESEGEEDGEEGEKEEDKPKTKTVEKTVHEWEVLNKNKPIWTRAFDSVTDEEYNSFFQSLSKTSDDPLVHEHFEAEGNRVKFRALLYIPSKAPYDLYDRTQDSKSDAVKLYVRRVLLSDQLDSDFLPQYLNFIKGVVDSDDLPINVSRETLQKSAVLKMIGDKVTKKVLRMLRKLANEEAPEDEDEEAKEDESKDDEEASGEESDKATTRETPYEKFWSQFSRSIKLGVLSDSANKDALLKLLRFTSTRSPKRVVSLEQYVSNMPENQKYIYYISGPDQASVENSPMLEQLKKREFEVLFFVDNIDEWVSREMQNFEGKQFMSVNKEGIEFGDETEDEKEVQKQIEEEFKATVEWINTALGSKVSKVVVSQRVAESPAVLVSSKWGWSANMERIMRAQALSQQVESQKFMMGMRTLEVNPNHSIVQEIKRRVDRGETDDIGDIVNLLYDSALINSGFSHDHVEDFVKRINTIMASSLNVENKVEQLEITPKPKVAKDEADSDDDEQEDDHEL